MKDFDIQINEDDIIYLDGEPSEEDLEKIEREAQASELNLFSESELNDFSV